MVQLMNSLKAWKTDAFSRTLKREVANLPSGLLPLHRCTTQGGQVDDSNLSSCILKQSETDRCIQIKLAIFFIELVGGCNCHDDPVTENGYCELLVCIDKQTAVVEFTVIDD